MINHVPARAAAALLAASLATFTNAASATPLSGALAIKNAAAAAVAALVRFIVRRRRLEIGAGEVVEQHIELCRE
jgi:hypothetical protein